MIISSWLASIFGRLKASSVRSRSRVRNRRRSLPAAPTMVELLEQRQLLTNPAFTSFSVNIAEAEQIFPYPSNSYSVGQVIATVNVSDPDIAPNNYVKGNLTITGGNLDISGRDGPAFFVNANDQICVNDPRDLIYELTPNNQFVLAITATDAGGATGTGTVTINLINQGRDRPVIPQYGSNNSNFGPFNYGPFDYVPKPGDDASGVVPLGSMIIKDPGVNVLRVKENSINGTIVGQVTAIDNDSNPVSSPLTYSLQGTIPGKDVNTPAFSIDPFTGVVRVIDSAYLNYEALRDQNNPNFGVGNLGEGGLLFGGVSRFPDVVLDLQVRATDTTGQFSQTSQAGGSITDSHVFIRVLDVSETPPNVANSTKSLNVDENRPTGTSLGYFQLINGTANFWNGTEPGAPTPYRIAKAGLDPTELEQRHSFAIVGGNTNNAFAIDYTTGELTVNNPVINYEALNVYNLQIQVTDDNTAADAIVAVSSRTGAVQDVAPLSTVASLRIDVNDINELTSIPAGQTFSIPENSVNGTIVGTVIANDPDIQKPNGKGSLVYSIVNGNTVTIGGVNHDGIFAIDSATGVITVNNTTGLTNPQVLDFENQPSFGLTVLVVDRGDSATSANSTITINLTNVNEKKPSVQNGTATIDENRPLNTYVGQVIAVVGEPGNSITNYQITAGNTSNAFAIDPSNGRITVSNPGAVDFETNPQFVLTIKVTDNGTPSLFATGTFTININNLNEQISMLDQSFSVNENSPNNFIVGQIFTSDPDNTATFTQGKSFVINAGNTGGAFAIDNQGVITVANTTALNFEAIPTFFLAVTVTDAGVPSTSMSATMTINLVNVNDPPGITNQSFNVTEHSLKGTVAGTVLANDEDVPAQTLSYAILSGDPTGAFSINSATGAITVTDPGLIDYTTTKQFSLVVQVTDNGTPPMSSSAVVTIFLLDAQEPQLPDQTVSLAENSPNTTLVTTVTATHGLAPYTYSILSGNVNNAFAIDANGNITVMNSSVLDFEKIKSFALKVLVVDSQPTPLGDTATITINLTNVNEAPALISLETTPLNYIEKATVPLTATIVATDPDSFSAQGAVIQLTTNYQNGQDTLVFNSIPSINITGVWNPANGTMTLSGVDSLSNYRTAIRSVAYTNLSSNPSPLVRTVTFQITDDGGLPSPTVSRTINVVPVNDPPVLASTLSNLSYTEGAGTLAINPFTTVNDPDSPTLVSGVITLTTFQNGEDVLGFVPNPATTGNIAVTSNVGGVLQLTSAGGTATLAQWQAAFQRVTYTNTSQNPTTTGRTVTFVANDGSSANNLSNALVTTITLTAVNNPPVLTNPSNVAYLENSAPVLIDSGIGVSDPDNTTFPSGVVTITNFVTGEDQIAFANDGATMGDIAILSNTNGQLSLYSPSATATAAQWQAAFASVTYFNSSSNPTGGARNVTFVLNDGSVDSNVLTSTVTVNPVNNPPVLSGIETTPLQYIENTAPNFTTNNTTQISATVQAADPDSLLTSATIQITLNYVSGQDFLVFTSTPTIQGSFDGVSGTLTLTGSDTVANYTTALESIAYFNRSDSPSTLTRTVSYTVTDDGGPSGIPKLASNTVTRNINVTAVNDPPVLKNVDTSTLSVTEDAPPVLILPNVAVSDADSNNLSGATITISANYNANGSQDILTFVNTPKITGSWDAVNGILTLTGVDTVSNYRSALRSIAFSNQHDGVTTSTRTVTFVVTDDTGVAGNTVSRDINITTHPNAAILAGIETTAKVFKANDPYTPATPVTSTITVTDYDSTSQTSAVINISKNYVRNEDQLLIDGAVLSANGLSASWNGATGALTLTGNVPMINYQNALRAVKYVDTSSNASTATRTVSFQVFDDTTPLPLASNIQSRDITVVTTNIPPQLSINAVGSLAYTEKDSATSVAPALTIVDADSPNMNGATIKITGNYQFPQDQLVFTNTATIQGSWTASSGTLTLSGLDTQANYQAALQSVKYLNTSNNPSSLTRTVSFVVSDGLSVSNTATRNVTVTPVNDPPTIFTNAGSPIPYTAATGTVVVAPTLTVMDPDSNNLASAQVSVSFNYQRGNDVLSFVNTPTITGVFDVASGILTLSGSDTVSNYRTALQSVTYAFNGTTIGANKTIAFTASDGTATSVTVKDVTTRDIVFTGAPPVVNTNASSLAYSTGNVAVNVAPGLTVTDPDSSFVASAVIQITSNYTFGVDVLSFVNTSKIAGVFDASTGTLTLTGYDTVSNYRSALRSVTYTFNGTPGGASKTIGFSASDGNSFSNVSNVNVIFSSAPPVVNTNTPSLNYSKASGAVNIAPVLTVTDPDSNNLASATIRFSSNYQSGFDVLLFTNTPNITGSFNATTGVLTLTGLDSVSAYRSALRSVQYQFTGPASGQTKTVSFTANDGFSDSNASSISITVSA